MSTKDGRDTHISLVEAVEALSNIADLEFDRDVGISERHDFTIQTQKISYKTIQWLHHQGGSITMNVVRDIFRTILHYLKNFYREEYTFVTDEKTVEGVKTIMVLVGEAAKKLDKFTDIFHSTQTKSVTELPEYKQLQEFYMKRISRKIDSGKLGKWLLALSEKKFVKKQLPSFKQNKAIQTKHIFVDMEGVKKDTEYELFFIRKEDGSRFFNPRLIRNIKLVCDFGNYFKGNKPDDPLSEIDLWLDRSLHLCSKNLLEAVKVPLRAFYKEFGDLKNFELTRLLNKCAMALMCASNPANLMRHNPIKNCAEYFFDFQTFLRVTLRDVTYQKAVAYPSEASQTTNVLIELIHALCFSLYTQMKGFKDLNGVTQSLLQEAHQEAAFERITHEKFPKGQLCGRLHQDFTAVSKLLKKHPNGPLNKLLNILENGNYGSFDPLWQDNLPMELYSLCFGATKIVNARIPAPLSQDFIHKAVITDEFKAFLRAMDKSVTFKHVLLFNLQDRTSWKEHARASHLEEFQNAEGIGQHLTVVTLAKDTEFYHQLAPYHEENHASVFMETLSHQIGDLNCGFYLPAQLKKALKAEFLETVIKGIHKLFFNSKNVLSREQRMSFIEIFYALLELKIIEIVNADLFSFTCKDALDVGGSANAFLFSFLKMMNASNFNEQDRELLDVLIFTAPLLIRERPMLAERFNRFINALKIVEATKEELGEGFTAALNETFGAMFAKDLFAMKLLPS